MRLIEETDLHRRQRYARELNALVARFDRLDDAAVRSIVALLQDLRKGIGAALLDNPGAFEAWRLAELRASMGDLVTRFEALAGQSLGQSLADAGQIGIDLVDRPIAAAGIGVSFNAPLPQVANIAADFSAMLVRNISDGIRSGIDTQLRLAVLGNLSPFQVMKNITDVLGVKAYDGVWGVRRRPDVVRGVAGRAEAITRTELTRVLNLAHTSRANQAAQSVPGLEKRWQATGDSRTRPAHLQAHWETLANPVPVDKPFIVGGEKMMQPGDPNASAANTINCRCRVTLVVPGIGIVQTPQDVLIEEERMRRKNA